MADNVLTPKYFKSYKRNVNITGIVNFDGPLVSGFQVNNCLSIPNEFNPEQNTFEIVVKITSGATLTGDQTFLGSSNGYRGIVTRFTNNKIQLFVSSNTTAWDIANGVSSTLTVEPNVTYYVKTSFTGTNYLVDVSSTGAFAGEETNYITVASTLSLTPTIQVLGTHSYSSQVFTGSIDLSESYIKINNEIWWQGISSGTYDDFDYEVETTESDYDYTKNTIYTYTYADQTFYSPILINADTVLTQVELSNPTQFLIPTCQIEGVNITGPRSKIVYEYGLMADGTPYVNDSYGIYSCDNVKGDIIFNAVITPDTETSPIEPPSPPEPNITVKKALLRLQDGTYIAPYTDVKGALDIGDIGMSIYVNESEGLRRRLNGSTVSINTNTLPLLNKLKMLKTQYASLFCTEDRWWSIASSNYFGQCGKFVIDEIGALKPNVNLYGDLTVQNTQIGNFLNNSNYLTVPNGIPFAEADTLECLFKIYVDTPSSYNVIIGCNRDVYTDGSCVIRTDNGARLKLWGTTNNSAWTTSGVDTGIDLVEGWQYIKFVYDGANYKLASSPDGQEWTTGAEITSSKFANANPSWLGATGSAGAYYLRGKIDLAECYIKVNGETYWEGITPSERVPYIRLPKIVSMQGALSFANLGEFSPESTRVLVAERKPTLADTRWYRWYSDGWLEQGGYFLNNNATDAVWRDYTVTLLKPYKDTLYNANTVTGHGANTNPPCMKNMTVSTFQARPYNDTGDAQWQTWGWAAVPTKEDANIANVGNVQYPYFIQIASGERTLTSIRNDWKIINPYTLFEYKYTDYYLNNSSWLLSLGQQNEKKIYPYAYEALCVELDNSITTGTTVELSSGGKYTKHLSTIFFDKSKVNIVGTPNVTINGVVTGITQENYPRIELNSQLYESASKYNFRFKFQYTEEGNILCTTKNTTVEDAPNSLLITSRDNKLYVNMNFGAEPLWNIEENPMQKTFTIGNWYYLNFAFDDSTGYKISISEDGSYFETVWEAELVGRIIPNSNYLSFGVSSTSESIGLPIDLKTLQVNYTLDSVENTIDCIKYEPLVWDSAEHTPDEELYNYKFIVDKINENFRLPTTTLDNKEVFNRLYFFIGDVAQNTNLVDVGRLTEAYVELISRIEKIEAKLSSL